MKISYISVDIYPIYPISVIFDTISTMIDISPIYRFLLRSMIFLLNPNPTSLSF